MINLNEDALVCDLAETYQIYDYRSLPVKTVATLSAGLRDNSRIKMCASGVLVDMDALLLAVIADRIEELRYFFSADSKKGRNRPKSITEILVNGEQPNPTDVMTFSTGAELEAALAKITGE